MRSSRFAASHMLVGALLAAANSAAAELVLFEGPGITQGNDAVECVAEGNYRHCASDAGSERILSHDGLPPSQRIPLDFQVYLPAAPVAGPDGMYPLVVFIHGWAAARRRSVAGSRASSFPTRRLAMRCSPTALARGTSRAAPRSD